MATCLQCDNCGAVIGENDPALKMWWRLERYGQDWVDEPHRFAPPMPAFMQRMIVGDFSIDPEDGEIVLPEEIIQEMAEEPSSVSLHFCKAACLGGWAEQADAMES